MPSTPADLLPVREASRLVGRGYSTVRGWIAAGEREAYRGEGTHPSNAPVLVSRGAAGLPWWRRLLGSSKPPAELAGPGEA